jgi:hypothetical protein
MSRQFDPTVAGPAGLFFRTGNLSSVGWQQEHEARASLERWCAYCGQSSCYGFGETLTTAGVLSCADPSCIASAEAEIARRDCPAPPAKPSKADAALDLFGRAA